MSAAATSIDLRPRRRLGFAAATASLVAVFAASPIPLYECQLRLNLHAPPTCS
ncbi:MAG: hypothetical protein J2P27_04520 [Actinobacteria bacterium]|nr:hypothetical protein [Actinomycetota bacterium]